MKTHALYALGGTVIISTLAAVVGAIGLKAYSFSPADQGVCGGTPTLEVRFSGLPVAAELHLDGGRLPVSVSYLHSRLTAPVGVRLEEGPHTAQVVLRSPLRTISRQWSFTVDTTPPPLTVLMPADQLAVAESEVSVTGRTEPGASVSLDGQVVPADSEGGFSFPISLKKGWNTFVVRSADQAGNDVQASTRVFSDTQAPTVRVLGLADGGVVKQDTFVLKAQAGDDGGLSACNVSLDEGPFKSVPLLEGGKLAIPLKKLPEGSHRLLLEIIDRAGRSNQKEVAFVVDSTEKFGAKTLILGARGADVKELQKRLLQMQLLQKEDLTGTFDENTLAAVQTFQAEHGMEADGVVGRSTLISLGPRIVVNLGRFELVLDRPGQPLKRYGIACGMPDYPTPTGQFEVAFKEENPTWIPPPDSLWAREAKVTPPGPGNPLGTRWIGLNSGVVGIHGTNADYSIGSRASHGCLRMHISDVEDLFPYVDTGTPVLILSGSEGDPALTKYW